MPMTYTDRRHFANLIMEFANGRFFHGSSIVNSLLCPVGGPLSLSLCLSGRVDVRKMVIGNDNPVDNPGGLDRRCD